MYLIVKQLNKKLEVRKRLLNEKNMQSFKIDLSNVNWPQVEAQEDPNVSYGNFFDVFSELYNKNLPIIEYVIKVKYLNNPWMSKGLK